MTWKTFEEQSYILTEAEIKALANRVVAVYSEAYREIDAIIKDMYLKELSGIDPKDYYNHMLQKNRLVNLQKQIRAEYIKYSKQAGNLVTATSSIGISNNFYRRQYATNWLVPGMTFGVLPKDLVELAVKGTDDAWKAITKSINKKFGENIMYQPRAGTLSSLLKNNRTIELNKIQRTLSKNLVLGKSYTSYTKDIQKIIGQKIKQKDGTIKITGSKASAIKIIRTEGNRTMNAGAYANSVYAESLGVNMQKEYVATLDNATRAQSASMDGQRKNLDEPFVYPNGVTAMYPGISGVEAYDINDRCTMIDIIEGLEPSIRRGRNPVTGQNEVFDYKDFDTWAKDKGLTTNIYGELVSK